jgi:hypothetical protein
MARIGVVMVFVVVAAAHVELYLQGVVDTLYYAVEVVEYWNAAVDAVCKYYNMVDQ